MFLTFYLRPKWNFPDSTVGKKVLSDGKHVQSLRKQLDEMSTELSTPNEPVVHAAEQIQADLDAVGHFDPPAGLVVVMEKPAITAVTLKGRLLGIKFTNGWHVGKVCSHSMRT